MTISENDRINDIGNWWRINDFMPTFAHSLYCHKALTYVEYRAVSASSKILTPHPLSTQRVCPPPPPTPKAGGTHSPGGEGGEGSIFWKRHDIGLGRLASYTIISLRLLPSNFLSIIEHNLNFIFLPAWLFFICLSFFLSIFFSFFLCFFQPQESVSEGKVSVLEKVISRFAPRERKKSHQLHERNTVSSIL
jgi:hypothetical protein